MTGEAWWFAALAAAVATVWLALYRLPFRRPRTRQRFRLAVASRTPIPARFVFPIIGTVIYLLGGVVAAAAVVWRGDLSLGQMWGGRPSIPDAAVTLLVVLGAAAWTGFAMSLLYAARPQIDIPGAVSGVGWIREILVLPRQWRWVVPMSSAAVEEFYFRGIVLIGLLAYGASPWHAIILSGLMFVAGQVVLTERALAAVVLGVSSAVLSVLCGLLVVVTGSVLPAILVHASFAGYYTNLGTAPRVRTA